MRIITRITRVLAVIGIAGTLAIPIGAQLPEKNITITGTISCSLCAGNHSMKVRKGPNQDANCTRTYIMQGSSYVLVKNDQLYRLDGDLETIRKFVGQRVTVRGTLSNIEGHNEVSVFSVR